VPFKINLKLARLVFLSAVLSSFLTGCGAPTKQAVAANMILSLLSNVMTAFVTKDAASTDIIYKCGDQSGADGAFAYSVPSSLTDPLQLINNPNAAASLNISFAACVIKACDQSITLSGGTASLGLGLSASSFVSGQVPAKFTLTVSDQSVAGFFGGTWSYSYAIEATFDDSLSALEGLEVKDADTPNPLTINGVTINGANVQDIADGC
jgi:hypothetical protein